jgi:hypothetical protein
MACPVQTIAEDSPPYPIGRIPSRSIQVTGNLDARLVPRRYDTAGPAQCIEARVHVSKFTQVLLAALRFPQDTSTRTFAAARRVNLPKWGCRSRTANLNPVAA